MHVERNSPSDVLWAHATGRSEVQIEHLAISPAHNFFGHHGAPAGVSLAMEVSEIECVAARGLRGDRFFDYKPNYKGQVTFFAMEVFAHICDDLELSGIPVTAVRRNVFTRGLDLNTLIGCRFALQGLWFFGTEECRPCYWMDQAIAPGAEMRLRGCGGLRAQILSSGFLRLGAADVELGLADQPATTL